MVNRGPSTGCQKCRERRTKCDEARPACRRCIIRGYACPGYRDISGVIFRDESRSIIDRHSQKPHDMPRHSGFARSKELGFDPNTMVIPFFFKTHILPAELMGLSSRGHFDHLGKLYSKANPSSPLALAVFATAARAIFSHLQLEQKDTRLLKNDMAAIQALEKAIANPEESLRDETLLAVLCLDFGTHYGRTKALKAPSRAHLDGALALIHHRGPKNFETPASRALFTATRNNALLRALWYREEQNHNILSFPDVNTGVANPVIKLQFILLKVLKLDKMTSTDMHFRGHRRITKLELSQELQLLLDVWIHAIPAEWRCVFENDPASDSWFTPHILDHMPCLHVASVLAQWLLTKFLILKFSFAATPSDQASDARESVAAYEKYRAEAQAIAEKVCQLLVHLGGKFSSALVQETPVNFNIRDVNDGHRLSDTARAISFSLSEWSLAEFSKQVPNRGGFNIAPEILQCIRNEHEHALSSLGTELPSIQYA